MCIPSFVLIGCCGSKLHSPEAVYSCFTRTTLFTTMFTVIFVVCEKYVCTKFCIDWLQKYNMPIPWSLWISIAMQSFVSQLFLVIDTLVKTEEQQ